MPEADSSIVVILLSACAGFIFMVFLVAVGIRAQLGRLERLLADRTSPAGAPAPAIGSENHADGPFEKFLTEDPLRKDLSKKEQAAAYRKWRQENGMNWSNS